MLDNPSATLEAIKTALAAALPTRVVTRDFLPHDQRSYEEMAQGVLTLVSIDEGDYQADMSDLYGFGELRAFLIGQFVLGDAATGSQVEDAEFAFLRQLLAVIQNRVAGALLVPEGKTRFSSQMERPYGWFYLEVKIFIS